jgi:exopolyphosphatase / guanosine-5'-triphosphate,3'-diphosphate pyrophosphatase
MIGTSGTVTTVGAAHLGLRRYDRRKVDGMTCRRRRSTR